MKITLTFTPQASPTYVPLGPALLAGLAAKRAPQAEVRLIDLNLTAWEHCASLVEGGPDCLDFFRGRGGNFFDEEEYGQHQHAWARIEAKLASLSAAARKALAGGKPPPELTELMEKLFAELAESRPDLLGFSLFSLGQLPWVLHLAKMAKARLNVLTMIGGAATTALDGDELLAACPFVGGLIEGEGDEGFLALALGTPLGEVPGLAWSVGGEIRRNPPPSPWLPATSPDPDFSGLPLSRYLNPVPVLPVLASRGCKWGRCRFCAHNSTYLGGYRPTGAAATAQTLSHLTQKHDCRHYYFADLYLDAPDLGDLAGEISSRGLEIAYHVLGRPTSTHTPELMALAARSGLRWISWGVESASAKLLKAAGKGTRAFNVEKALKAAHGAGISNLAMMIYGLPTSTDEDLEETFAFLERCYLLIDAMTASPYALFSNSPFGEEPGVWGLVPLENQVEITVGDAPVHSRRQYFSEIGEDGEPRPPRGELEAARWSGRRHWLGEPPFMESLPCEHYLLFADRRYSMRMASTGSSREARHEG